MRLMTLSPCWTGREAACRASSTAMMPANGRCMRRRCGWAWTSGLDLEDGKLLPDGRIAESNAELIAAAVKRGVT